MGLGNSKPLPVPALEQPLPQRGPVWMLAKLRLSKIAASLNVKCGTHTLRGLWAIDGRYQQVLDQLHTPQGEKPWETVSLHLGAMLVTCNNNVHWKRITKPNDY